MGAAQFLQYIINSSIYIFNYNIAQKIFVVKEKRRILYNFAVSGRKNGIIFLFIAKR
jgi:hypothetical protein